MLVKEVKLNVTLVSAPAVSLVGLAAKFCTSPQSYGEIVAENYEEQLQAVADRVMEYGHLAVAEFDDYVFAVEGVSRTLTHQLVRKRLASYAQESMRYTSQAGEYKIVIPESVKGKRVQVAVPSRVTGIPLYTDLTLKDLADIAHQVYEGLQAQGVPNEDARFALLEASKTKILVKMNAHALMDFFAERTCSCAQWEIRGMASWMLELVRDHNPSLFRNAGPKCIRLGFCPEARAKHCGLRPHRTEVYRGL